MSQAAITLPTGAVIALSIFQTVSLAGLLVPWPLSVRKPVIRIILESPICAKLIYGTKIACIFIALMWTDAAVTLYNMFYARRVPVTGDNSAAMEKSAKWLVAQRQLAVCSVALFLSVVLYCVVALQVRVLTLEEEVAQLQGKNIGKPIEKSKEEYEQLQGHQGPDVHLRAWKNKEELDRRPSKDLSDKDAAEAGKQRKDN